MGKCNIDFLMKNKHKPAFGLEFRRHNCAEGAVNCSKTSSKKQQQGARGFNMPTLVRKKNLLKWICCAALGLVGLSLLSVLSERPSRAAKMSKLLAFGRPEDPSPEETETAEDPWLQRMRLEQERRRAAVRDACAAAGPTARWGAAGGGGSNSRTKPDIMVDLNHRVGLCRNAKAGSSTLMRHFLNLDETLSQEEKESFQEDDHYLHIRVPPLFAPRDIRNLTLAKMLNVFREKNIFTFTFVRHPFERLVSAYDNKMLHPRFNGGYYMKMAEKIGKTFPNFVDFVISLLLKNKKCLPHGECKIDPHWTPFNSQCAYCDIDYDVIGKVETFDEDFSYVVHVAGLRDALPASARGLRRNSVPHADGRTEEYFKQLSHGQKLALYSLFRIDFELFGYSPEPYIQITSEK